MLLLRVIAGWTRSLRWQLDCAIVVLRSIYSIGVRWRALHHRQPIHEVRWEDLRGVVLAHKRYHLFTDRRLEHFTPLMRPRVIRLAYRLDIFQEPRWAFIPDCLFTSCHIDWVTLIQIPLTFFVVSIALNSFEWFQILQTGMSNRISFLFHLVKILLDAIVHLQIPNLRLWHIAWEGLNCKVLFLAQ